MKVSGKVNYKDVLRGDNGYTYTPHINDKGILSWTNNGNLPNPTPIKIRGKDGSVNNINFFIDERGHLMAENIKRR